jgi:hypothetical protein
MYFSLRTENQAQREQVEKTIDLLKKTFGESNINEKAYGTFTTVETKNISGLVDFTTTHSLSLFDSVGENAKKLRIDIELLDVVYDLER